MIYGSLCSGIGGLDLAVEAVFGASPAWFCEADTHAAKVLTRHWPGVPVLPDLKTQDWSSVEPVELVCAGYPCQPFSMAGRRAGAADPRHLWPYVIGAVRVLRPRLVVLENVAGHLGLGFDRVLADLAEAGFDAEWAVVRASDVGACHRRERLFVVAADTDGAVGEARAERPRRGLIGRLQPLDGGDAVPPDPAHVGCERGGEPRGRREGLTDHGEAATDADSAGLYGGHRPSDTPKRQPDVTWGDYGSAVHRWEHVLGRPAPAPTDARGRLSVEFVEWMMGFDAGWVDGLTRTAALRCLGNAVVPQQGTYALAGSLFSGEVSDDAQ